MLWLLRMEMLSYIKWSSVQMKTHEIINKEIWYLTSMIVTDILCCIIPQYWQLILTDQSGTDSDDYLKNRQDADKTNWITETSWDQTDSFTLNMVITSQWDCALYNKQTTQTYSTGNTCSPKHQIINIRLSNKLTNFMLSRYTLKSH